ncbi:hypothetical protein BRCON_1213 [Candidatus Sumerlaea chitinivorans]|uniref:Uncharacterized protein n=1 Tax=Sumerlaea chitinivorans TaxID=2250252 RepID=A0A2Z4Y4B0_SUMC1|nr:hypothetical protein BRCON_1213 [Candidatus Sumerlaea chitinivorans]
MGRFLLSLRSIVGIVLSNLEGLIKMTVSKSGGGNQEKKNRYAPSPIALLYSRK